MTAFGPQGSEIALVIALAYIVQVQAAAWYVSSRITCSARRRSKGHPLDPLVLYVGVR